MTIDVKIIADSIGPNNVRLTTMVWTYPRFQHAEVMTHRMFSRNASSSRAIPVAKQIQMVIDDPAIPMAFTRNKAGMQGGEALVGDEYDRAVAAWMYGRDHAVACARELADLEVHKQYANRVLEPYAHITVVVTATDWDNFFALRYHEMALPEMQELAKKTFEAMFANIPHRLAAGQWHLPFVSNAELGDKSLTIETLIKMSVARCARVSYLNHEGKKPTLEEDLKLYDRLLGSQPIHASPAEHQAAALEVDSYFGNLRGWLQYRKTLLNENVTKFTPPVAQY